MAVTDTELVKQAEYMLLENGDADADGTFLTSQFSVTQLVDALNDAQYQFLKDTALVQTRTVINSPANVSIYNLPARFVEIRRLARENPPIPPLTANTISPLLRTDAWELDHGQADWGYNLGQPIGYHVETQPTLQVEIEPAPIDAGFLHLLYVELSTVLTGAGVALSVPDEWSWCILYRALATLLAAEGEANDPQRANYCLQRYMMGVELARLMMRSTEVA